MRGSKVNITTHDFKFDSYKAKICAFDGCRIVLSYTNPDKHQVLNDRRYCSLDCLKKQYQSLNYRGAVHLIHQIFGPDHPVTKQIQEMKEELSWYKKEMDLEDRKTIASIRANKNWEQLMHLSEKCL